MDTNGNAIIVWQQSDGSDVQIFKSEYRGGFWTHPWSHTDHISPDGSDAYVPEVALDTNGNAIIVWEQWDSSNRQIFKSEYRGGFWTHPSSLTDHISPDGSDAGFPEVAMDTKDSPFESYRQHQPKRV
jgi:hypothetical protein